MLGFVTDELVWTVCRERLEEARRVHPHTARQPDPERTTHEAEQRRSDWLWSAPNVRASRVG
jgi:hypothetical protein